MFQLIFGGFAAVRLAVLEESEAEENVLFNKRPQPVKPRWSLDTEDTNFEDRQHQHGSHRKSKVAGNAQSNVAFSSPLVRCSLSQEEKADI